MSKAGERLLSAAKEMRDIAKGAKIHRVPIMMSAGELAAIDDWRFAHRLGSRAEAIRLLCAISLAASAPATPSQGEAV